MKKTTIFSLLALSLVAGLSIVHAEQYTFSGKYLTYSCRYKDYSGTGSMMVQGNPASINVQYVVVKKGTIVMYENALNYPLTGGENGWRLIWFNQGQTGKLKLTGNVEATVFGPANTKTNGEFTADLGPNCNYYEKGGGSGNSEL